MGNVKGKYVRLIDMVNATGHSAPTIKKMVKDGRIKTTSTNKGTRYLLPEKQIAYSAAGAKKLKEKKIMETDGQLITIKDYTTKTGLPRATLYQAIKDGWLPTEQNQYDKKCIRWFNKTKNLSMFRDARENFHNVEVVGPEKKKITDERINKAQYVKVGTMLPPKMWCELTNYPYISMMKNLALGVFNECSLKVDNIGSGEQRKHYVVEWPGLETASAICEVLKRRLQVVEKQYQLNVLCNTLDEAEEKETETRHEAPQEPIIEPEEEPIKEPIKELIVQPTPVPEPEGYVTEEKFKYLESKVDKLEGAIKKMILEKAGW